MPHVQSTVEPSYSRQPTIKPLNNNYNFQPESISGFEPVSHDPYETSVATLDTHQHLTETTPIDQFHQNLSTVEIKPITYDSFIPTSSSKPIHELLNNMNKTSLQLLLNKLKEANYLPKTFTMNKLDNSLRTLAKVLSDLKKGEKPIKTNEYSTYRPHHRTKPQPIIDSYDNIKPIYPVQSNEGKLFSKVIMLKFSINCFFFAAPGPQSG